MIAASAAAMFDAMLRRGTCALLLSACAGNAAYSDGPPAAEGEAESEAGRGGPGDGDEGDGREGESEGEDRPIDPDDDRCGGEAIPIELAGEVPDVLLVVDRSGSMAMPLFSGLVPPPPPWGETKWDIMVRALAQVTAAFGDQIRFGLMRFPSDNACGAGVVDVEVGPGTNGPIQLTLWDTVPDGWTPMDTTLTAAREALAPLAPATRYVVLATDGMPVCEQDEQAGFDRQPPTLAAVQALSAGGVTTFVIGFSGSFLATDQAFLGRMAQAGGTGEAYLADTPESLIAALEDIAGAVQPPPCEWALQAPPPDPDLVTVRFYDLDGNPQDVPRDPARGAGWEYDPDDGAVIRFYGEWCDRLRGLDVERVEFIYGCPGPILE